MTPRERFLTLLFIICLGSVGLLFGVSAFLDTLTKLDTQFIGLQKRGRQLTLKHLPSGELDAGSALKELRSHFWAKPPLPPTLTLASTVHDSLVTSGLNVQESRVVEDKDTSSWVEFQGRGTILSWFRFVSALRLRDPHVLLRSLTLVRKGDDYSYSFEAGHVLLP